jgi:hypothetical protein
MKIQFKRLITFFIYISIGKQIAPQQQLNIQVEKDNLVIAPCSLVEVDQCFRSVYCLHQTFKLLYTGAV